mgnify:CR=1 FL=1
MKSLDSLYRMMLLERTALMGSKPFFIIDTLQGNPAEDLNGLFKPLRDLCDMKEVSFELITRSCNFSLAKSIKPKNKKVHFTNLFKVHFEMRISNHSCVEKMLLDEVSSMRATMLVVTTSVPHLPRYC